MHFKCARLKRACVEVHQSRLEISIVCNLLASDQQSVFLGVSLHGCRCHRLSGRRRPFSFFFVCFVLKFRFAPQGPHLPRKCSGRNTKVALFPPSGGFCRWCGIEVISLFPGSLIKFKYVPPCVCPIFVVCLSPV